MEGQVDVEVPVQVDCLLLYTCTPAGLMKPGLDEWDGLRGCPGDTH